MMTGRQVGITISQVTSEQQRWSCKWRQCYSIIVCQSQRFLEVGSAAFTWLALCNSRCVRNLHRPCPINLAGSILSVNCKQS